MKNKILKIKDINYKLKDDYKPEKDNELFLLRANANFNISDLLNRTDNIVDLVKELKVHLEHDYPVLVTNLTIVNANKFIKNCPKNMVFQWIYKSNREED